MKPLVISTAIGTGDGGAGASGGAGTGSASGAGTGRPRRSVLVEKHNVEKHTLLYIGPRCVVCVSTSECASAMRPWLVLGAFAQMTSSQTKYNYPLGRAALGKYSRSQDLEDLALYEQFFTGQRDGRFLEMGALDGLALSNTYAYEMAMNWTGVLIEATPAACRRLFRNRPRATNLCTAVSSDYRMITFEEGTYSSTFGSLEDMPPVFAERFHSKKRALHQVPSAPLGQLLRMAGVTHLDLASIDVEGSEVKVLETMDWTIPVRVWCIEWQPPMSPSSLNASIAAIMTSNGYKRLAWAHEYDSARPLDQNQLWVWQQRWTPEFYSWQQYRAQAKVQTRKDMPSSIYAVSPDQRHEHVKA